MKKLMRSRQDNNRNAITHALVRLQDIDRDLSLCQFAGLRSLDIFVRWYVKVLKSFTAIELEQVSNPRILDKGIGFRQRMLCLREKLEKVRVIILGFIKDFSSGKRLNYLELLLLLTYIDAELFTLEFSLDIHQEEYREIHSRE